MSGPDGRLSREPIHAVEGEDGLVDAVLVRQRRGAVDYHGTCRSTSPSAPEGPKGVATCGARPASSRAERNPWKWSCDVSPAPEGQRIFFLECLPVYPEKLLRPCRGGFVPYRHSTGSAALHPWLHPCAPTGRRGYRKYPRPRVPRCSKQHRSTRGYIPWPIRGRKAPRTVESETGAAAVEGSTIGVASSDRDGRPRSTVGCRVQRRARSCREAASGHPLKVLGAPDLVGVRSGGFLF